MNKESPNKNDQAQLIEDDAHEEKSSLPSRSELHNQKRQKSNWKIKYPVIKLLALFFVLLPIVIYSVYSYNGNQKHDKAQQASTESNGFETVDIADKNKKTSYVVREDDDKEGKEEKEDKESKAQQDAENVNNSDIQKIDSEEHPPSSNQTEENTQQDQTSSSSKEEEEQPKEEETKAPEPQEEEKTPEPQEEKKEMIYHTVQPNETLFRISMNYYQSQAGMDIIRKANGIQGNNIKVGQVLKIPK
ncbi:LysM peptidoglycan-binding domain-containing protein [Bacillus aquiflavi]|uniref:LysM peptidoglycan-binding domain-containing protein n=1 Tax=Bacillus aquiflavi TaxID=2672567 RepID=A0A6B3W143_9BACI|nr:LysM peptidoglycan-binding domain-containing protein [Bacillus aquiflavi]MBA4537334.1 LysM peptidoglycan-binding domain-containing protein [Bacillus aquiflavi]NEY81591.1 LysM peptidoglycan-binding domain-containing protein [Bacillus aquiflavi]UAC47105.1 LysM peptidoglycan-binding domain-containing protein [Bacillus aquiflavi]